MRQELADGDGELDADEPGAPIAGTDTDAVSGPTVASTGGRVTDGRPPAPVVTVAPGHRHADAWNARGDAGHLGRPARRRCRRRGAPR